ncbi:transketolase [Phenylobacterium sp.]|uniref:transketolase n=1 Tax=Phenylobacterium sp. TaxID=1871053 RepID=UPI003BAC9564
MERVSLTDMPDPASPEAPAAGVHRFETLAARARHIRRMIIEAIHAAGTGHAGSSLSMVEILVILYFRHMRVRPHQPAWPHRDRFVLSKGHGAPALYAVMAEAGFLPLEELRSLRAFGSRLQGHPNADSLPGVDATTGSLGQGLSIALGMALGLGRRGQNGRVFCMVGDGELQEGQCWEAFLLAPALGVGNLVVIVDRNGLQNDGRTEAIAPLGDLAGKLKAFGWRTAVVDGHDFHALDEVLRPADTPTATPLVVIAETVKGKGVSFMENQVVWHHKPLSPAEHRQALAELGEIP